MKFKSLSATSAHVFELCESRWKAEKIDYADQETNKAAALGSACHEALEHFVARGHHVEHTDDKIMASYYTMAFEKLFVDKTHYAEGLDLVLKWKERQDWTGRKVLSTEVKENFLLPTSEGDIPVNYIWDRSDELDNGEIEITDYKTSVRPLTHEQLRHNLQARLYGLAAQLKHPDAPRVWVTFDYLRHVPIGVVFTKEENRQMWWYMRRLAERIIASDGEIETLNEQCRWCVRRHVCGELRKHIEQGGPLGIIDPIEAANQRVKLLAAKSAISAMIDDLDGVIASHMETNELAEFETDEVRVVLTMKHSRAIDDKRAAKIIGPEIMAEHGGVTLTLVDKLLKGTDLTVEQKNELRALIYTKTSEPSVKTEVLPKI